MASSLGCVSGAECPSELGEGVVLRLLRKEGPSQLETPSELCPFPLGEAAGHLNRKEFHTDVYRGSL